MNKILSSLKNYELRNAVNCNLERKSGVKDLKASEGPIDITNKFSDVVDKLTVYGLVPQLPSYLRYARICTQSLRFVDESEKFLYVNDNIRRINEIDKILNEETKGFFDERIEKVEAKFLEKYDNVKEELKNNKAQIQRKKESIRWIKRELREIKNEINKLREDGIEDATRIGALKRDIKRKEQELYMARMAKVRLGLRRASIMNVREKNVVSLARDINRIDRSGLFARIVGNLASFAIEVMLVLSFPISKLLLTSIQLPAVFARFVGSIDTHIFKKLREKSESSRRDATVREQLKNINKEIGQQRFNEIVANEKDLNKQLEALEKSSDTEVKRAFESARRAANVLYAKPKWYLRMFSVKTLENDEKIENTAKFVMKQIKELPDEEKILEALANEDISLLEKAKAQRSLRQAKESLNRLKAMLEVLGIDNPDDYIRDVKDYKNQKEEDKKAAIDNNTNMTNADKNHFGGRKNDLKNRLVDAIKQRL